MDDFHVLRENLETPWLESSIASRWLSLNGSEQKLSGLMGDEAFEWPNWEYERDCVWKREEFEKDLWCF